MGNSWSILSVPPTKYSHEPNSLLVTATRRTSESVIDENRFLLLKISYVELIQTSNVLIVFSRAAERPSTHCPEL
jgi:hypothetical protein